MDASITEETATAPAAGKKPKATRKPNARKAGAHVASAKPKAGKKATPAKKTPKGAQKAKRGREGSKSTTILDLLKRKDGATLKELMKVTGWQAHSVRGFLSGTVGKKMGLSVTSVKGQDGERTYSIEA
jgi:uncharacterized protein DUF3489